MKQPVVSRSLHVMGGTAVFHGTRVPVQTLLDHLEAGETIDDFLEGFPSVTRRQVIAFLQEAKDRVTEAAIPGDSTKGRTGADLIAAMQKGRRLGLKLKPSRIFRSRRPPIDFSGPRR